MQAKKVKNSLLVAEKNIMQNKNSDPYTGGDTFFMDAGRKCGF
jgi:hypothetical protein